MPEPEEMLRALADPERLSVAGLLARGPATERQVTDALGLPAERVRRHLSRLTAAGVIGADGDRAGFHLLADSLREAAVAAGPVRDPGLALGAIDAHEEAILRRSFRGGRLKEIPAKRSTRLVVLTRLALEFEVGVRYPERDVNATLSRFHDDHASLRRYLVDEGLLSREGGLYWRTGGPVDV